MDRRKLATALFTLGLVAAIPVHAQVNIERLRRSRDTDGFVGTAAANVTARTGNVRLVLLSLEGRMDYVRPQWLAFVIGNTDVGWQAGRRFSNAGLVHVRVNRHASDVVSVETFGQVDYDKSRLLTSRAVIGGGPRVSLETSDSWRLAAGTGYMYERERLDLPADATHPSATNVSRWTNYLSVHFRDGERLSIAGTFYAQPRFDAFDDVRALTDVRLGVQLVGSLSLTVTSRMRYDSRPPDGVADLDTAITTGLALSW
jgi:hypothetical protein